MAKLTVQFRDGETVSAFYPDDRWRLFEVIKFVIQGVTIKKVTIEL